MKQPSSIRTQILIFILFGEYILPRGGEAWTVGLLKMLETLGVSERAARSTLSRMQKRGWLRSRRNGRYSRYSLTQRGLRVVREGEIRIFEPRRTAWDGRWHMVVYSVPEQHRDLRSRLRRNLGWLGFGRLAPGTWISPNDRRDEVKALLSELEAQPYAVYFSGMQLHFASDEQIVRRCWDLPTINQAYREFIGRYRPAFIRCQRALEGGDGIPPQECFRQRFWLTLDYSQFPRWDPNLPPALLPAGWLGGEANELFLAFHNLLRAPSEAYVDLVLESHPQGLLAQPS
jgi:phenylacetic acid degradation operon negative regulatory protein